MSFEDAQDYISKCGFDIPWNDGDVFVDDREITRTIGNVLKWRINSAWHDFEDEIPEKKRPVLIESKSGGNNVFLLMVLQGDEEREDVASYRRWAYIEDLIPDMTEEAGKEDAP